jgi:hypothetical protein
MAKRPGNSLQMAFTTTAVGVLFMVAGVMGYSLDRHERFVSGATWKDHVIWWEIAVGAVALLIAVGFWRAGLRWLRE